MEPNTASVRHFLTKYFDDAELTILCFDYFPDVYRDFAQGMSKSQKVQLLLDYCQKRGRWADLLAALQRERLGAYETELAAAATTTTSQAHPGKHDPHQVFISHAHEDVAFAHRLADDLSSRGWQVWIAPESIQPGEKWLEAIERGLAESGVFLSALTGNAVKSRWVKSETNIAIELEHQGRLQFIPLQVEAAEIPLVWRAYQYVSFLGGYEKGLQALLARLQAGSEAAAQPVAPVPVQPSRRAAPPYRLLAGAGGLLLLVLLLLYLGPRLGWWGEDGSGGPLAGIDVPPTDAPPGISAVDPTESPPALVAALSPPARESPPAAAATLPATDVPTEPPTRSPTRTPKPSATPTRTPAPTFTRPPPTSTSSPPTPTAPPITTQPPTPAPSPPSGIRPSETPVDVFVDWFNFGQANAYTDIFLVYADGGQANLTNDTHRENSAVLSPDRTQVAFERGGPAQIFVMNVDGTGSRQLTPGPQGNTGPQWSNDGTEIFYLSWADGRRYAINVADGQARPLE